MGFLFIIFAIAFGVPAFVKMIKALPYVVVAPFYIIGLLFTFTLKSFSLLTQKWWAWLIQISILFFQTAAFIGAYAENQIGLGIFLVIVFQVIAFTLIFNMQRIIQKDY